MDWKIKTGIIFGALCLIACFALIIKMQYDANKKQAYIEQSVVEMKRLSDEIVRNQGKYSSKEDLEKFAKDNGINLSPIQDDLKKLNANINAISVAITNTPGYKGTNLSSSSINHNNNSKITNEVLCKDGTTVNCLNPDKFNYLENQQNLNLNEPFSNNLTVPWGSVSFSAWRESPWDIDIYQRKYLANTVLGVDEEGRHFAYSQFSIETDGHKYLLPISNAQFLEQYPESKFRFNLLLHLGVDAGIIFAPPVRGDVMPNLQLSLFSYGKTKILPEWTFASVGVGYLTQNRSLGFLFSPINYNLGQPLPLINNFYIGPSIVLDTNNNFAIMMGVKVEL